MFWDCYAIDYVKRKKMDQRMSDYWDVVGNLLFLFLEPEVCYSKINEFEHWTVVVSLSSRSNMGRSCLLISKTT